MKEKIKVLLILILSLILVFELTLTTLALRQGEIANGQKTKYAGENNYKEDFYETKIDSMKNSETLVKYPEITDKEPWEEEIFIYEPEGNGVRIKGIDVAHPKIKKYKLRKTLVIPEKIDNKNVVSIGETDGLGSGIFFEKGFKFNQIIWPDTMTKIGYTAFRNYKEKLYISLPENLISIGNSSFVGTENLVGNLELPDTLTYIGEYAFSGCENLESKLIIPDGVTFIGDYAFRNCYKLYGDLEIPGSVKTIGSNAFQNCTGFHGALILNEGLESVKDNAFLFDKSFDGEVRVGNFSSDIRIPNTLKKIDGKSFYPGKNINDYYYNTSLIFLNKGQLGETNFSTKDQGLSIATYNDDFKDLKDNLIARYRNFIEISPPSYLPEKSNINPITMDNNEVKIGEELTTTIPICISEPTYDRRMEGKLDINLVNNNLLYGGVLDENSKEKAITIKFFDIDKGEYFDLEYEIKDNIMQLYIKRDTPVHFNIILDGILYEKDETYPHQEKYEISAIVSNVKNVVDNTKDDYTIIKTKEVKVKEANYKVVYNANVPKNMEVTGVVPNDNTKYRKNQDVVVKDNDGNLSVVGYEFKGWGLSKDAKEPIKTFKIENDTTLYAQWELVPTKTYEITFNSNGGNSVETQIINKDDKVIKPVDPTKEGYIFSGWFIDEELTNLYNFETTVTDDFTLYAKWEEMLSETYTISFNSNGGSEIESQIVNKDDKVTEPESPIRERYIFKGWFIDEELTNLYDFETTVTGDFTLYAKWDEVLHDIDKVKLIYNGNGSTSGIAPAVEYYNIDDEVIVKDRNTLINDGYIFSGWENYSNGDIFEEGDRFYIAQDTELFAIWNEDKYPIIPIEPTIPPNELEPEIQEPSEPVEPDLVIKEPMAVLDKENHYSYMVGYSDGTFRPNANITRAEALTIFFRMLTEDSRNQYWSSTNNFNDVKKTAWYNNALSTMENIKVIEADANGNYRPNEAITRAEFTVLLSKFFNETGTKNHNFTDIKGHIAESEIARVVAKGWIEGYADSTFRPDEKITRAETVKLINRILERTPDINKLLPNMIEFKDSQDVDKWYYVEIQEAANSHEYTRSDSKSTETWTKLLPVRDWVALEKEWSKANSSTNPGNVK